MQHNPAEEPAECPDCGRSISRRTWDALGCVWCLEEDDE